MVIDLGVAVLLWLCGFAFFGRFIVPRWKILGKFAFYLSATVLLHAAVGHWAVVWVIAHPLAGVAGHAWWCRRHGIDWLTCRPRDRYLALRPWAASDGFNRIPAEKS